MCFRARERISLYHLAIFTYLIFTYCKYSRNMTVLLIIYGIFSQMHDSACRLYFPSVSFPPIRQMTSALDNVPPSCFLNTCGKKKKPNYNHMRMLVSVVRSRKRWTFKGPGAGTVYLKASKYEI